MNRRAIAAASGGLLVLSMFAAGGASAATTHPTYALGHAKSCRVDFVKRTERHIVRVRVKVRGHVKLERRTERYVACVYVAPLQKVVTPVVTTPPTLTLAAPLTTTPTTVRATIDPSWTLDASTPQAPPVPVTFTYDATTSGTLPDGTLTLSIFTHSTVASAGGCQANVGGAVTSATCKVNLPAWGSYDLITSYSGGSNVSATGQTETVDIEPPAPSPETVMDQWGATAPTNGPTAAAQVIGSNASVSVSDGNWEGANAATLTDQLGDSCSLAISGTTGTCTMAVTGTPSSFTVAFPGGTSTTTSQTVSPWGIAQTQDVTYDWPAETVVIAHPTVTASVMTIGTAHFYVDNQFGTQVNTGINVPASISVPSGGSLRMNFSAVGTLLGDTQPQGYLSTETTASDAVLTNEGGNGSNDCTMLQNYVGEAGGTACQISFPSAGSYSVTVDFHSEDPSYADQLGALTVVVTVS